MSYLKRFDFNKKSGWISIIFVSVGISLLIFAGVYLAEGLSWLSAENEQQLDVYEGVGWNWVRGAGFAFASALVLLVASLAMLSKNKQARGRAKPLFSRLDLNAGKGLLGLVLLSVSLVFFFNAALYRIEVIKWVYAAVELSRSWYLDEASGWVSAATTMAIIGTLLSATGWMLIALGWKKK
jgi:hypothetical protein